MCLRLQFILETTYVMIIYLYMSLFNNFMLFVILKYFDFDFTLCSIAIVFFLYCAFQILMF